MRPTLWPLGLLAGMFVVSCQAAPLPPLALKQVTVQPNRVAAAAPRITPDKLKAFLDKGGKAVIIDVRPAEDYAVSHLPGAVSMPLLNLLSTFRQLPKDRDIVLYCSCPAEHSSEAAARELRKFGYTRLFLLRGGDQAWAARGYPMSTTGKT